MEEFINLEAALDLEALAQAVTVAQAASYSEGYSEGLKMFVAAKKQVC
jgi:hypothetical protein